MQEDEVDRPVGIPNVRRAVASGSTMGIAIGQVQQQVRQDMQDEVVWRDENDVVRLRKDLVNRRVYLYDEAGEMTVDRPFTAEENASQDALEAQQYVMSSIEDRVARIEAYLWPPQQPGEDPPSEYDDLSDGVWSARTLLQDGGKVWHNVSGVPLTAAPSDFPGTPEAWTHLFVEVATGGTDPEPDPGPGTPEGYVGSWSKDATYKIGDVVDRDGVYYRCKVAHGPEYQGTWGPPQASVWDVVGPVG